VKEVEYEKQIETDDEFDRLYYKIGKYVYEQHEKYKDTDDKDMAVIVELLQKIMFHAIKS
jgi:hypothetical protein